MKFRNFLSFGNIDTEINFLNAKKTLISGKNGSGKSTIIDAVTFVLFGKPFRKIPKGLLVNSINQKDLLVELDFKIHDVQYKIIRGQLPTIFEIYADGTLISQDASCRDYQSYLEKDILKLNYRTFTQIVVLGSGNYVQFMKLSTAAKREIIEDILDIAVFSRMNDLLKPLIKEQDTDLQLIQKDKELYTSQYKFLYNKSLKNNDSKEKRKSVKANELEDLQQDKLEAEIKREEIKEGKVNVPDDAAIKKKKTKLSEYNFGIKKNLQQVQEEILFYKDHDTCPKCKKTLEDDFKNERISFLQRKKDEFNTAMDKLNESLKEVTSKIKKIGILTKKNDSIKSQLFQIDSQISSIEYRIASLKKDLEDIENETEEAISKEEIQDLKEKVKSADKELQNKHHEIHIMKLGISILKDTGAKTSIIKFYLPLINKTINNFLEKFDFNVSFMFDENFDETMKARHIDSFRYGNFSEGERNRIDLALVFSWREIAKKKNSASTNLLFFDEVLDSGMDAAGLENFMQVLDEFDPDTNIFIISHREGIEASFDSSIKALKENNFSRYE